jgi:hypothetical protein
MSGNAAHQRPEDARAPSLDSVLVPSDDARLRRRLVIQIIRRAQKEYTPLEISKMLRLQRCGFWLSPENVTSLLKRWAELRDTGFDLGLMSAVNDVSRIPTVGKSLVVVAAVEQVLHFRIFDGDGKLVVDTDEGRLTERVRWRFTVNLVV